MDIKEEVKTLREQIEYHSNRYYNMDAPEITDYEYDMLMQRLKQIEKEHPELVDAVFSDTKSRWQCQERGRSTGASQCANAEFAGCLL